MAQIWRETISMMQRTRVFPNLFSHCFVRRISIWSWVLSGASSHNNKCNTYVHIKGRNITRVSYKFNDLLLVFHVRRVRHSAFAIAPFHFSANIRSPFIRHLVDFPLYREKIWMNVQFSIWLFIPLNKTRFRNIFPGYVQTEMWWPQRAHTLRRYAIV